MTDILRTATAAKRRVRRAVQTRADILRTAVDLASVEGLEGLTIGRLALELGMSKSGLFAHFGSKEELQLAVVEAARDIFIEKVADPPLAFERGLPRLEAMLESWLAYVESSVFRGGCFFLAASAEFDDRPGPVRDLVATLTKAWLDALTDEIREGIEIGHFDSRIDPAQIAFEVHAFAQEANWTYRLLNDDNAFNRARTAVRRRLASVIPPEAPEFDEEETAEPISSFRQDDIFIL